MAFSRSDLISADNFVSWWAFDTLAAVVCTNSYFAYLNHQTEESTSLYSALLIETVKSMVCAFEVDLWYKVCWMMQGFSRRQVERHSLMGSTFGMTLRKSVLVLVSVHSITFCSMISRPKNILFSLQRWRLYRELSFTDMVAVGIIGNSRRGAG